MIEDDPSDRVVRTCGHSVASEMANVKSNVLRSTVYSPFLPNDPISLHAARSSMASLDYIAVRMLGLYGDLCVCADGD